MITLKNWGAGNFSATKWDIACLLFTNGQAECSLIGGTGSALQVTLISIERESGTGQTFNLTVRKSDGTTFTIFVRTQD